MKKVQMRKRRQEAEVEKLLKKVSWEKLPIHPLFLLDHLCPKRTSKAAVLLQKAHGREGRRRTQ